MSNKVTLTGHFTLLDGTPAAGTVLIRPSRSPILDLEGNTVIAGPQRFQLDAEGRFSANLPPTDDPTLGEGFTYHVMVTMEHTHWQVIGLTLPTGMVSVDVLDPPAGVVKEYPTRAEWDALTGTVRAEMEAALSGAETARDTTLDARDTTVVARDETVAARDVALTARDTAVSAASDAETARTETLTARDATLTARDETTEARDATFTARTETITTAGEAESARDTAVGAAGDAETARDEVAGQLGGAPRLTNLVHGTTWLTVNATIDSQTDRTVAFTVTNQHGHIRYDQLTSAGVRYYFTAEVKATSAHVFFGTQQSRIYHSGSGDWERLTGMVTPTENTPFLVRDSRPSGLEQTEVRDPMLINLTEAFGAGREPTREYVDALLANHGNYIGGVDQFAIGDALQAFTVAGPGMTLRHDTSVGERVMLDHPGGSTMLHGDTGWRNIPPGEWTIGTFQLRRVGSTVSLRLGNLESTGAEPWIPDGFKPQTSTRWPTQAAYTGGSGSQSNQTLVVFRTLRIVGSVTGTLWETVPAEFTWTTTDSWPTALPGTPA